METKAGEVAVVPIRILVDCRFQVVGFHQWSGAPLEVDYLRKRHRHVFHFRIAKHVTHDNRAIEFHTMQRYFKSLLKEVFEKDGQVDEYYFGERSCEMIAIALYEAADAEWKPSTISVSEDRENTATVAFR